MRSDPNARDLRTELVAFARQLERLPGCPQGFVQDWFDSLRLDDPDRHVVVMREFASSELHRVAQRALDDVRRERQGGLSAEESQAFRDNVYVNDQVGDLGRTSIPQPSRTRKALKALTRPRSPSVNRDLRSGDGSRSRRLAAALGAPLTRFGCV